MNVCDTSENYELARKWVWKFELWIFIFLSSCVSVGRASRTMYREWAPEMVSECHFTGICYPRWFDSKEWIFMQKKLPSFSMHLSCNFHYSYHEYFVSSGVSVSFGLIIDRHCCSVPPSQSAICRFVFIFLPSTRLFTSRRQDDGYTDRGCNMAVLLGDCICCAVLPFSWSNVVYLYVWDTLSPGNCELKRQPCRFRLES